MPGKEPGVDLPVAPDAWVALAEVARPHGVRGELRLKVYNLESDALLEQDAVLVRPRDSKAPKEREMAVEHARRATEAVLLKLKGVDDRDAADALRGALVCVRRDRFAPLEEDEFYVADIVGARVRVRTGESEAPLGVVKELRSYPSVEVLVVAADDGGKDWEIPLVSPFVEKVDAEARLVVVGSLEGIERG
jgi:16S rRNA processing protein RimM